jgi:hypothetical protein
MAKIELSFFGNYTAYHPKTGQELQTTDTVILEAKIKKPICYWKVPTGARWTIPTILRPFIMKLYDSTGTELPANTRVWIGVRSPIDSEDIFWVGSAIYRPWSQLTLKEQISEDYIDRVVFELNDTATLRNVAGVSVQEDERVYIGIELPAGANDVQFNYADSTLIFYVEETRK